MRRQITSAHTIAAARDWCSRLDRAAYRMNPYLMAIVVGLSNTEYDLLHRDEGVPAKTGSARFN